MWIDGDALVSGSAVKATSSFDLPLIRTMGKAFYWQQMIDTGEVANASELARRLKLEAGWVCKVLRMTRLAPDIIRAILDGRQPRHLNFMRCDARQAGGGAAGSGRAAGDLWVLGDGDHSAQFGTCAGPRAAAQRRWQPAAQLIACKASHLKLFLTSSDRRCCDFK